MNSNSFYILIDGLIAAGGLYIIYLSSTMMKTGVLKQNGLMSKNVDVKKCKDVAGYIKFIGMKQLAFGILALVMGLIGLVHDYTGIVGTYVYLACIFIVVAYIIYYSVQTKKANQLFW